MSNVFDAEPVMNIKKATYFYEETHKYMGMIENGLYDNIGINGSNLTIVILSLNRSELTIKLLESIENIIPNFSGEILIVDNSSTKDELIKIKSHVLKCSLKCRVIELDTNYGVAGGRNRAIPHINTEWLMTIDNDMYFIYNPLEKIRTDIATLGCRFLNIPFFSADKKFVEGFAGHIYIGKNELYEVTVGAGRAFQDVPLLNCDYPSFLGTFLYGGSAVYNLKEFVRIGMFDNNMFIGFEDIEFSTRLFNSGIKIGNLGMIPLVHDHKKPVNDSGKDYELKRHSYQRLYESAMYMNKKTGLKVWNAVVDEWLKQKNTELGIGDKNIVKSSDNDTINVKRVRNDKGLPDILLVVDIENWAFHNISKQLVKNLSNYFNFTILPMNIVEDNNLGVILMAQDYDLVHFFWRANLESLYDYKIADKLGGMSYEKFLEKYVDPLKITTCVYDHSLIDANSLRWLDRVFNRFIDRYYVSSKKLYDIYTGINLFPNPFMVLEDGVDTSLFKPINISRFDDIGDRNIVIGWAGNSKWSSTLGEDFKGLHTIIKPVLNELINEGYSVTYLFADRNEKYVPLEEMPKYYSQIDILVCASKIEGTPNPVLEAMACGVPVISTDVGIVPQVFGDKQKEFMLKLRNKDCLKAAILKLIKNKNLFKVLSQENLISISSWDWEIKTKKFYTFFNSVLLSKQSI